MIDVDLLSVIRRWHGRDRLSIREIGKRTGLSGNTIRKYLANGEVTPQYPARKSASKLDPYAEVLGSWLTRLVDPQWLRWALGLSFLAVALWMLVPDQVDEVKGDGPGRLGDGAV